MSEPELAALAHAFPAQKESEEVPHESLGRLRGALVAFDRRSEQRDAQRARAAWSGLTAGDSTLLQSFESDGRRYLLVRQNPAGSRDRGALSALEARALGLRARCASFKLIAYELGLSAAAAHGLVRKGLGKLGVRNENELPSFVVPPPGK